MFESAVRLLFASIFAGAVLTIGGCGSPGVVDFDAKRSSDSTKTEEPSAPEPSRPAPLPAIQDGELSLSGPVLFETRSEVLRSESAEVLVDVKRYLEAKPDVTLLRIEGHTDSDGDDQENQRLSERRALTVARWLVSQGIDCRRLLPVGFGETKPIAPDDMPANKAQNRRISFEIAALRGRPIGGMPVDGHGTIAGDPCQ